MRQDRYKVVIDSMSAHIAILDDEGKTVEPNRARRDFARQNGMVDSYDSIGVNYFSVCEVASDPIFFDSNKISRLYCLAWHMPLAV